MRLARRVSPRPTISSSGIERGERGRGEGRRGARKKTRACRCISPHVTWIERGRSAAIGAVSRRPAIVNTLSPLEGGLGGGGLGGELRFWESKFLGCRYTVYARRSGTISPSSSAFDASLFPRITATFGLSRGRAKWACKHLAFWEPTDGWRMRELTRLVGGGGGQMNRLEVEVIFTPDLRQRFFPCRCEQ